MDGTDTAAQYRPLLFSIAYRMLGSVDDAEDIVQETLLRWAQVPVEAVRSPKDYLCTMVTRRCIDHLRSARVRREEYVGVWLPEPLMTGGGPDPSAAVTLDESLSTAFLLILERLSPPERAAFLLREVFDYSYNEISQILDRTPAHCRQIVRRARLRVIEMPPRRRALRSEAEEIARRFREAATTGDMGGLLALLAEDASAWVDGGGKVPSARRLILGAHRVARYMLGIVRKAGASATWQLAAVNGGLGIIRFANGKPAGVLTLNMEGGVIRRVFYVVNPEKLKAVPAQQFGVVDGGAYLGTASDEIH